MAYAYGVIWHCVYISTSLRQTTTPGKKASVGQLPNVRGRYVMQRDGELSRQTLFRVAPVEPLNMPSRSCMTPVRPAECVHHPSFATTFVSARLLRGRVEKYSLLSDVPHPLWRATCSFGGCSRCVVFTDVSTSQVDIPPVTLPPLRYHHYHGQFGPCFSSRTARTCVWKMMGSRRGGCS